VKVEINLNLDEFKNLLVNCDEFRQLLATGIEEPATETVESVGGVKGDEPSATKQERKHSHHGDSPGKASGINANWQTS
jgi:hypothetical protein